MIAFIVNFLLFSFIIYRFCKSLYGILAVEGYGYNTVVYDQKHIEWPSYPDQGNFRILRFVNYTPVGINFEWGYLVYDVDTLEVKRCEVTSSANPLSHRSILCNNPEPQRLSDIFKHFVNSHYKKYRGDARRIIYPYDIKYLPESLKVRRVLYENAATRIVSKLRINKERKREIIDRLLCKGGTFPFWYPRFEIKATCTD